MNIKLSWYDDDDNIKSDYPKIKKEQIVHEHFSMQKLYAKWVPQKLTIEEKI